MTILLNLNPREFANFATLLKQYVYNDLFVDNFGTDLATAHHLVIE